MRKSQQFENLEKRLKTKHFRSLSFHFHHEINTVELEVIMVKEEFRKQGLAKYAMREICKLCDELEVLFVLYPSNEFGTPRTFLHRFYRSFGFKYVAKKDYMDKYKNFMKRKPAPAPAPAEGTDGANKIQLLNNLNHKNMYHFRDIDGKQFSTKFSPFEISNYIMFDAQDKTGDTFVIEEARVNYKSFYYL